MAALYDRPEIYDLLESEGKSRITRTHWETLLKGKTIHSVLDVSIGSGNTTLPLAEMGMELHGSDLSAAMLERCRSKAEAKGLAVDLHTCDFRRLTEVFHRTFDCVVSTGNSLAYVPNDEITGVLEQMDALVAPGGYLYFDLRNWDKIVADHQRFYLYNPHFDGDTRINLVQVWDYHSDQSMTFNLLFTFEKNNRIFQMEKFEEHYFPVSQRLLLGKLEQMGYENIQVHAFPVQRGEFRMDESDWYCVLAQKPE